MSVNFRMNQPLGGGDIVLLVKIPFEYLTCIRSLLLRDYYKIFLGSLEEYRVSCGGDSDRVKNKFIDAFITK